MKKIIILSGPPSCGKDTAAKYIEDKFKAYHTKFSKTLKERTHLLYNLSLDKYPYDYFEDCKNKKNDLFYGLTPRQAYINVAEKYFKRIHGLEFFGKLLVKDINENSNDNDLIVLSDGGFKEEVETLIKAYGKESINIVRIYRDGCNFKKDSREYLYFNEEDKIIFNNNLEYFLKAVDYIVNNILDKYKQLDI